MIIARVPFRVSFFGGGTAYPRVVPRARGAGAFDRHRQILLYFAANFAAVF